MRSPPATRAALESRLAARRSYNPRIALPTTAQGPLRWSWQGKQNLEAMLVVLSNRPDVAAEATAYATKAPMPYEWEGYPDGPMAEAEFAEKYRTAAARYISVWQRLQTTSDVVIKAIAEDLDARAYLYADIKAHPRTFKSQE